MITSELECAGSCTVLAMPDHLFPDGLVASARFTFGLAADGSWEVAHMQQQAIAALWPPQLFCGGGEAGTDGADGRRFAPPLREWRRLGASVAVEAGAVDARSARRVHRHVADAHLGSPQRRQPHWRRTKRATTQITCWNT